MFTYRKCNTRLIGTTCSCTLNFSHSVRRSVANYFFRNSVAYYFFTKMLKCCLKNAANMLKDFEVPNKIPQLNFSVFITLKLTISIHDYLNFKIKCPNHHLHQLFDIGTDLSRNNSTFLLFLNQISHTKWHLGPK